MASGGILSGVEECNRFHSIILRNDGRVKVATTIRQVAAAAGVSVATASRALNGSPAVVDATRQRVLRVATELDFTPSRLARSLANGSSGNIGVILPDVTNPFYTSFLAELESTLAAEDIGILIGDSRESPEREAMLARRMSTQVDGLVLASSRMTDEQIIAASRRIPVVLANRMLDAADAERLSQLTIDVAPGFSAAVHHLHSLGHRRLSYIDGPERSWSGRAKRRVLETVCAQLGMPLDAVRTEQPDFAAGRAIGADIAARTAASRSADHSVDGIGHGGDDLTAVIAFNDQVALGVLSAFRDRGIDVPGRISVVGCDDSLPDGLAWPALTTVDSSSRMLGGLAAAAVLDPASERESTVPTRLIVRDSTAPASAPAPAPSPEPQTRTSKETL
jgi:DNA-binding LacI/PurR family transcriptional regulator